ncbi:MAG: hypothetical protein ACI8U3_001240 [Brevundimonas sp.]|jgi:hypothetical protein
MTILPTPRLIGLGAARRRTRADMEQGAPELIPTSLWRVPGWSR